MNTQIIKQFIALKKRKAEIKSEEKDLNAEIAKIEKPIIDAFTEDGVPRISVDELDLAADRIEELKIRKAEIKDTSPEQLKLQLLDDVDLEIIAEEMSSTRGTYTVSTRRNLRGSAGGNMPALISALKAACLDMLVNETVNAQRLTAWVNEFDADERKPKDPLAVAKEIENSVAHRLASDGFGEYEADRLAKIAASTIKITETFTLGMVKS